MNFTFKSDLIFYFIFFIFLGGGGGAETSIEHLDTPLTQQYVYYTF